MTYIAKVFQNGRSQAVRLPAAFRFDTPEVYVRRDEATGDIILSRRPDNWSDLIDAVEKARSESADFLSERGDEVTQPRDIF